MKWKTRYELPVMKRLDIHFDIGSLQKATKEFSNSKIWDGLGNEYASLCRAHTKLPEMFFKKEELENIDCVCDLDWKDTSYQQLSLTKFDETYSLDNRTELSETKWDTRIAKKDPKTDERWFGKRLPDIPEYFNYVLDTLGKIGAIHRTRFAALKPRCEVKPHMDYDTTYGIRLHIAINTNENCVNGGIDKDGKIIEQHIPADGSVWFINPGVKHWVKNSGDTNRIHLIISADSQKFLEF